MSAAEDWQIIPDSKYCLSSPLRTAASLTVDSQGLPLPKHQLDIIHTQTEFSLGLFGVWLDEVAVPVIHTYHTQYEDYVR